MSSFPLTNSIICQDGYCTSNQTSIGNRPPGRAARPGGAAPFGVEVSIEADNSDFRPFLGGPSMGLASGKHTKSY